MANPRIVFLEHVQNGVLVDAASVTLQDPTGVFGIREAVSEIVTIPPGAPTVHVGTGQYEYNIGSLNTQIEYEVFWMVVDTFGNTQFIYGIIPIVTPSTNAPGPQVPINQVGHGTPIPGDPDGYSYIIPWDGYIDAYGIHDGYAVGYDYNNDNVIDQLDIGRPTVPPFGPGFGGAAGYGPSFGYGGNVPNSPFNGPYDPDTGPGYFNPQGVRIGLGGNNASGIPVGGVGHDEPGNTGVPDGIPDVPSPRGTPATGGTFGGTFGYDGTSGDVPATGGARTNRDEHGNGYWDGISFKKLCTFPIGPRGQCLKDKCHAVVRAMLKDTDSTCHAFSDDEIDMYLESSLWAFNARPTFTAFFWDNLQERWLDIICKGAVVWALYAQGLIEAGREFTITDNGISFTPPPVSDKLHNYAAALLAHYDAQLAEIKQNFRPIPAAVGIFSVLDVSPSLRRLRHLREKRIF